MKEFLFKHPVVTLLGGLSVVKGVVKIAKIIAYSITGKPEILVFDGGTITTTTTMNVPEGGEEDAPAGDIH